MPTIFYNNNCWYQRFRAIVGFCFSKLEITQKEIYISLQQSGKLSPLRRATKRYKSFLTTKTIIMILFLAKEIDTEFTFRCWKLFLDFLSSVAWPTLIMLIVIFFEKQIRKLIKNIKKVEAAGGSIEINNQQQSSGKVKSLNAEILEAEPEIPLNEYLYRYTQSSRDLVRGVILRESETENNGNSDDFNRLLVYSMLMYFDKYFRNIYVYIYGSQIELLMKLLTNNNETKESLKYYYDNAVSVNPNTYSNYSYGQYLQFLQGNELIHIFENNNIVITDQGRDFLTHLNLYQLPTTKPIH